MSPDNFQHSHLVKYLIYNYDVNKKFGIFSLKTSFLPFKNKAKKLVMVSIQVWFNEFEYIKSNKKNCKQ